jgi:hypothetical protein
VNPDGAGAYLVYCDMTTDGGGWTLMAKFSQNGYMRTMSSTMYNDYFYNNLWIDGYAEGVPTTPTPTYDAIHVESLDWSDFLATGASYELRQRFFTGTGTAKFDVGYAFTYNGYTDQNSTSGTNRAWELSGRRVYEDGTGIVWHIPSETVRFWLPFRAGITGSIFSACNSYGFDASACGKDDSTARRYGNAGIIGAGTDLNDPAASWAPHAGYTLSSSDVVFVHQSSSGRYAGSGASMTLLYYIR